MRVVFINFLIALMAFSVLLGDVQAKRFGGGKSFGMSRQASSFSRPSSGNAFANPASAAQAAPKPASTASKWLGPLAGLAAGGLLASLFMGHGLGGLSSMLSWVLIAGVIFFVVRLLMNRMRVPSPSTRSDHQHFQAQPHSAPQYTGFNQQGFTSANHEQAISLPADFNETEFLRSAKATFIRLQAAYDNKNLADIREFTAPEVFAEIQLQVQERGSEINQTEVVSIEAELLDVSTSGQTTATVLFTGLVREQTGAEPTSIKEMWHFNKDLFRPVWIVAGIQQA